jgi:hypothetical protein
MNPQIMRVIWSPSSSTRVIAPGGIEGESGPVPLLCHPLVTRI